MKKILFYYTSNKRTIAIESLIIKFKEQGNHLFLLTQSPESELHTALIAHGIKVTGYHVEKKTALFFYIRHLLFLVRFCRKEKIDIVYSHLQQANIVAVFAQFFSKAIFYICRHHADRNRSERNFNQQLFDKIINRLAKKIIVPSKKVYHQVTHVEKVSPQKVKIIYYSYDFSQYPSPDPISVEKIRKQYSASLLLVKIARLVPGKRHQILFEVLKDLIIEEKLEIKLIVISDGPLMHQLQMFIDMNHLQQHIFLLGNQSNVMDYLEAADAIALLSDSEASNNVIKEAGLRKKCVLVCNDVGDFDEYIEQNYSGLFLDKEHPENDLKKYLRDLYLKKIDTQKLGDHLHEKVYAMFSIENVIDNYLPFNSITN